MGFLDLNGWDLNVSVDSFRSSDVEIGSRGGAYSGASRDGRRAIGLQFQGTAVLQKNIDAGPLENMLRGRGHHFPFDTTLYADGTGVGPEAGYSATLVTAAPAPKYGTRCLKVPSATSISWIVDMPWYPEQGMGEYTLMFWFWNGASWDHYIITSAPDGGSSFKNGASAAAPGNYSVTEASPGTLTVTLEGQNAAGANADAYFDDLVILPFSLDPQGDAVATDAITGFYTAGRAFSAMPRLLVTGTCLNGGVGYLEMLGAVGNVGWAQAMVGGVWTTVRTVEFTLTEAAPRR